MIVIFWKNYNSYSNTFSYFLVTAISGGILLYSWINSWFIFCYLVLFFKIGIWPFSYWVVNICRSWKYLSCYIFLFLSKFLPFVGIFKYFNSFSNVFIFIALVKLLGCTFKLFQQKNFSLFKVFVWMTISSTSYWLLIGIINLNLLLYWYILYSLFMILIITYQSHSVVMYKLWMITFLFFLRGPPLLYFFFKISFLYNLPKKYYFMRFISLVFFFQSLVLIRVLIFSSFGKQ